MAGAYFFLEERSRDYTGKIGESHRGQARQETVQAKADRTRSNYGLEYRIVDP